MKIEANPPTNTYTTVTWNDETPTSNPLPAPYINYTRQVRIRPCNASGAGCPGRDAALRLVTVRVTYTPLQGLVGVASSQKYVELSMLVAARCAVETPSAPCP